LLREVVGDGSIMIREKIRLSLCIYQSSNNGVPPVLYLFQNWFGNKMKVHKKKDRQHKPEYSIQWNGEGCFPLLEILQKYAIIKKPQVDLAQKWLNTSNKDKLIREDINEKMKQYKVQQNYRSIEIVKERLTDAYIAGLFDAEAKKFIVTRRFIIDKCIGMCTNQRVSNYSIQQSQSTTSDQRISRFYRIYPRRTICNRISGSKIGFH
jgi:hypothetical protein